MKLNHLQPERVFKYFEEICAVPHGSENSSPIAQYCVDFAKRHSLKVVRDNADNVIIYKNGSLGYENSAPIILQGHTDMVCQKTEQSNIDFLKDGLDIYIEGDFVRAKDTSLGADNGIALAMILAVLESDDIPHPPIEAVFTSDEEIGMIGAKQLDMSLLKSKRMINLDSEEEDTLTVSCAGGSDFRVSIPIKRTKNFGTFVSVTLSGFKGGHSGVEINKCRMNADIVAGRFLNYMKKSCGVKLISITGGDKANAIPNRCVMELCIENTEEFSKKAKECLTVISSELSSCEPSFAYEISIGSSDEFLCLTDEISNNLIYTLLCVPNGVTQMSCDIEGLVETSLNLGVLCCEKEKIILHFALRSNKSSALSFLQERLTVFFGTINCEIEAFGHYPPWEYKADSPLRELYTKAFIKHFGKKPEIEAIHAGLECGVFASGINGLDCISLGPDLSDVHTTLESMSISSVQRIYALLTEILKGCK